MWFWRSNGSRRFACFILSLAFFSFFNLLYAQESVKAAALLLKVTSAGVTSYPEFQKIQSALRQSKGVQKAIVENEAPGLVSWRVYYEGESKSLIGQLTALLRDEYKIEEKQLFDGTTEINISKTY